MNQRKQKREERKKVRCSSTHIIHLLNEKPLKASNLPSQVNQAVKMDKITENKLVGAKKRKSFAVKLSKVQEAMLTDRLIQINNFQFLFNSLITFALSGYIEPSEAETSIENSNNSYVDKSFATREPSSRVSILKTIKIEKNSAAKTDERILKNYLIRKNVARKNFAKTMMKWKPRVEIKRLNPHEINILSNDWRFIEKLNITDSIEFYAEILAQHFSPTFDQKRFLVRWWPAGIMEDSWINESELPRDGIIKVDVQKMTWKQKILARDILTNFSPSDKKKQKQSRKQS